MTNPFHLAEEYIRLRKKCDAPSWVDTIMRWNELCFAPIVTLFFLFRRKSDMFAVISSSLTIYNAWSEWIRYHHLQFEVQDMYFTMMRTGGPRIVTNDPDYLPYVFADAVFRLNERRRLP